MRHKLNQCTTYLLSRADAIRCRVCNAVLRMRKPTIAQEKQEMDEMERAARLGGLAGGLGVAIAVSVEVAKYEEEIAQALGMGM